MNLEKFDSQLKKLDSQMAELEARRNDIRNQRKMAIDAEKLRLVNASGLTLDDLNEIMGYTRKELDEILSKKRKQEKEDENVNEDQADHVSRDNDGNAGSASIIG